MLIQINTNIVATEQDLIIVQNFYLQTAAWKESVHVYNKNKDILILGEGPTQGLDDTKLNVHNQVKDLH